MINSTAKGILTESIKTYIDEIIETRKLLEKNKQMFLIDRDIRIINQNLKSLVIKIDILNNNIRVLDQRELNILYGYIAEKHYYYKISDIVFDLILALNGIEKRKRDCYVDLVQTNKGNIEKIKCLCRLIIRYLKLNIQTEANKHITNKEKERETAKKRIIIDCEYCINEEQKENESFNNIANVIVDKTKEEQKINNCKNNISKLEDLLSAHYNYKFENKEQAELMYNNLIKEKCIDKESTPFDNFYYFMTGEKPVPENLKQIVWRKDQRLLCYFIYTLMSEEKEYIIKIPKIFIRLNKQKVNYKVLKNDISAWNNGEDYCRSNIIKYILGL
jgi:hypothetical protein